MVTTKMENSSIQLAAASNIRKIWGSLIINVLNYGAKGNLTNDDTTALQRALDDAPEDGPVIIPPGNYRITGPLNITKRHTMVDGMNFGKTAIYVDGNFNAFNITVNDCTIKNLSIAPKNIQTSGAAIKATNCGGHFFENLYLYTYDGIVWDRGSNGFIRNIQGSGTLGSFIKLYSSVAGGSIVDVFVDSVNARAGTGGVAGLEYGCGCSGIYVSKCNLMHFAYGSFFDNTVSGGSDPQYIFLSNVLADTSADNGFHILKGNIIKFNECWAATNGNRGFYITGGSDIWLNGCNIGNNGLDGVLISTSGSNENGVHLRNCNIWSNSTQGAGLGHGVKVAADIKNFDVIGCDIGRGFGAFPNTQGYGVYIDAGASDNYMVVHNNLRNNSVGQLADNGTGTNKLVEKNIT